MNPEKPTDEMLPENPGQASWVPVQPDVMQVVMEHPEFMTRCEGEAALEIMVWLDEENPRWSDVASVMKDMDHLGREAVFLHFNDEGANRLESFSEKRVGQYVAVIVNDRVVQIDKILDRISSGVFVRGASIADFADSADIRPVPRRSARGRESLRVLPQLGGLLATVPGFSILVALLVVMFLAALPGAPEEVLSAPAPRSWHVIGLLVLGAYGAYAVGVVVEKPDAVTTMTRIGLVPAVYGSLAGLLLGRWVTDMVYRIGRTALANGRRLVCRWRGNS